MARTGKIYGRTRGGETRYYGDFRGYSDVGGGREPLVPNGQKRATTDPGVAAVVYGERLKTLEEARRLRGMGLKPVSDEKSLAEYAAEHLVRKARSGNFTARWLNDVERHLRAAVDFYGAETPLAYFERPPDDLFDPWVEHLRSQSNGRGGTMSEGNVRKYLNSLGNLLTAAASAGHVRGNAVHSYASKPTEQETEPRYLDEKEAALFLEAARTFVPDVDHGGYPWLYPLVATLLLTGGRSSEVRGLLVDDVALSLGKVYIRPNELRPRLKSKKARRTVPLWPQLEGILRAYLAERERTGGLGALLFPSTRSGGLETMLVDVPSLDPICARAGIERITPHGLRHSYIAGRLQTLDRGAPVSVYTVAREVGHNSTVMIERVYGHIHDRTAAGGLEVVEFRMRPTRDTTGDTTEAPAPGTNNPATL